MLKLKSSKVSLIFAVATCLTVYSGIAQSDFYKGKTITVVAGTGAGSGTSLMAREFVKAWSDYIPGKPNFVIKHMPGAGGAKALTFMYDKGKPDGLNLYFGISHLITKSLNPKRIKFDLEKMSIIALGGQEHMTLINSELGIKNPKDLGKIKQLVSGGSRADDPLSLETRLTLSMLGINYRHVHGYRGMPKIVKAAATGEIQFITTATLGYRVVSKAFVAKGALVPMYYHPYFDANGSYIKSKEFSKLKSFIEVYREIHGKDPSGKLFKTYKWLLDVNGHPSGFVAPPGVDPKLVKILRESHAKATKDPRGKKGKVASVFNWKPLGDLERSIQTYLSASPEVLTTLKKVSTQAK